MHGWIFFTFAEICLLFYINACKVLQDYKKKLCCLENGIAFWCGSSAYSLEQYSAVPEFQLHSNGRSVNCMEYLNFSDHLIQMFHQFFKKPVDWLRLPKPTKKKTFHFPTSESQPPIFIYIHIFTMYFVYLLVLNYYNIKVKGLHQCETLYQWVETSISSNKKKASVLVRFKDEAIFFQLSSPFKVLTSLERES